MATSAATNSDIKLLWRNFNKIVLVWIREVYREGATFKNYVACQLIVVIVMCQNVGTLFLCDVVLWMATDPEMGEYKVSKSYSWLGPSPWSTIRDKRQPRVININLINIMVSYWRKYLYIKGRERGLARWVLNFHPNTKRGRGGRWGKKLFLSYVQVLENCLLSLLGGRG